MALIGWHFRMGSVHIPVDDVRLDELTQGFLFAYVQRVMGQVMSAFGKARKPSLIEEAKLLYPGVFRSANAIDEKRSESEVWDRRCGGALTDGWKRWKRYTRVDRWVCRRQGWSHKRLHRG